MVHNVAIPAIAVLVLIAIFVISMVDNSATPTKVCSKRSTAG